MKNKGKGSIPAERVRELTGRGFSEVEVIDVLRKEGYSPDEIDGGLTQSMKFSATQQPSNAEPALPTLEEITAQARQPQMPQLPETSLPEGYYQQQSYPVEEYVDYIVQARMGELMQKITEFSVRTEELAKRVEDVNSRINEIMNLRNAEQTQIISKIDTYGESNTGVETRLSGLEKAFKETLPALIESVRALTDLVNRMKREA